jgi:hypothetical protein
MGGHNYSKDQMNTNNQVAQQQLQLEQNQLAQYNNYYNQILAGGGYLPGVRGALTSEAIQSVPQNYNQASQQLLTTLGSRGAAGGGTQPGSGLLGQGLGQLYSAEAQQKSNLLNQITAQGQQNIAQGAGGLLGAAGTTAGAGTSALGSATNAANSATQNQTGLLGSILGAGLGVAGTALGGPIGGGIAKAFGGGGNAGSGFNPSQGYS